VLVRPGAVNQTKNRRSVAIMHFSKSKTVAFQRERMMIPLELQHHIHQQHQIHQEIDN
jgi:hypothetical protein